jgi:hypothetical protein
MTQQAAKPRNDRHQTMVLRECCVCQSSIYPDEKTTTCPKCGLTFHAECWEVNMGCAAYGCEQVDALKPKTLEQPTEQLPPPVEVPIERLPWDFMLLGAATIAALASTLTFGIPSIIVILACTVRVIRTKRLRAPIRFAAIIVAIVGLAVGVTISRFWWAHGYTLSG